MSLLLLWGGASTSGVTALPYGPIASLLVADEVAVGQECTIDFQVVDENGQVALDEAAQMAIYGFTAFGARTVEQALTTMTKVSTSDLYEGTWTPSRAGTFEIACVGVSSAVTYALSGAVTARPQFDPIALAVDDVFASRTDNGTVRGTA